MCSGFLFAVAAADLFQTKIDENPEIPPEDKYKLYDQLGDAFAQEGVYTFALENYEKVLEVLKFDVLNPKLITLMFSLFFSLMN